LVINVVLITQRGVGVHLPTMFYAMGPFGGKHVFVNGHAYLRHKCGDTFLQEAHFSVKFGIYVHKTTIFRGVLDNCPTYFYHLIIILLFNIYILKPVYVNYNP